MKLDGADNAAALHVAIIMDGNGRWAESRGRTRFQGHRAGAERLRSIVEVCPQLGVSYLTVYAFSTENWKRGATEVNALMELFRRYMRLEAPNLMKNGVRLRFIGDRQGLESSLVAKMLQLEDETSRNRGLILTVAINYGARNEIIRATQELAKAAVERKLDVADIDESHLSGAMFTRGLPDPDLIIRTSGESRLSNFLLWQCAYSEIDIISTHWPDFSVTHFKESLHRFGLRKRRFGAVE